MTFSTKEQRIAQRLDDIEKIKQEPSVQLELTLSDLMSIQDALDWRINQLNNSSSETDVEYRVLRLVNEARKSLIGGE